MSNKPLTEKNWPNIKINIIEPQNDGIQPSAQNDTNFKPSYHLSSSLVPVCNINRSELSNLKYIAKGGFGEVRKAQWNGHVVAAKIVDRRDPRQLKDFERELRALRKSKECKEHIIQFFGLSEGYKNGEYILVMQYADSGTLKDYLEINKDNIKLNQKISLCRDILKGLEFLHKEDIIHRDLHNKNVLIHQERALLADFGLSKSLRDSKGTSVVRGIAPYVDPKLLYNPDYLYDKPSDIYSFGVLMWEIYTCLPPFDGRRDHILLAFELCLGMREKPKEGMPCDYIKIYEKCWNLDPSSRPDAIKALNDLKNLRKHPTITEDDIQKVIPSYESLDHSSALQDNDIKKVIESIKTHYEDSANKMQLPFIKEIISERKFDKHEQKNKNAAIINNVYRNNEIECSNKSKEPKELNKLQETHNKVEVTKRAYPRNNSLKKSLIIFIIIIIVELLLYVRFYKNKELEVEIQKKQDQYDKLNFEFNKIIEILKTENYKDIKN